MAETQIKKNVLTVSASPHIRCDESISKIMWSVNLALAPAGIFGIIHFGIPALKVILTGIISAVVTEYIIQKIRKKPVTISDGSAFLTGFLLAMCLPPDIPPYMVAFGSFVAIAIAKESMGGLGYNIFNPAHVGRAALMASWPAAMTLWSKMTTSVDVVSSATPLGILKLQGYSKLVETFGGTGSLYKALFLGTRNGSIGETSTILLVLGGLFLIYKRYINWEIPVVMIGTVGVLTWIFGGSAGFSMGSTTQANTTMKRSSWSASPEVGTFLTDHIQVGLGITSGGSSNDFSPANNVKTLQFGGSVYGRYLFGEKAFRPFLGISGSFLAGQNRTSPSGARTDLNTINASFSAGFAYYVTPRIGIFGSIGVLGYTYSHEIFPSTPSRTTNDFGFNASTLGNRFTIGMYYTICQGKENK